MKSIILTITGIIFSVMLYAQDTIIMQNGDEVKAKVEEIMLKNIKYKMYNNLNGPLIVVPKNDVFMVKYQNGTKQLFERSKEGQNQVEKTEDNRRYMYELGYQYAKKTYRGNGVMFGTAAATLAYWTPGLIAAAIFSVVPPSMTKLRRDTNLIKNPDFVTGYQAKAFRKKRGKAWIGFGIGTVIFTSGIYILAYSSLK